MRIWLYTSVKGSWITSTAISVAAHGVLVGAAVYGAGVRARQLDEMIAKRVSEFRITPPAPAEHTRAKPVP
jgi:hypothetical protein